MRAPTTVAPFAPTAVAVLAVMVAGCGARTGVGDPDDAGAPFDASTRRDAGRDAGPPTRRDGGPPVRECAVSCGWCRPAGPAVQLADFGQTPDVTWDGEELLVVYDTSPGVVVGAVALDGELLWNEDIGGLQWARVTYDRDGHAGMVVLDSAVQWLGPDGRPVGERVSLAFMGWQLWGDIAATDSGFLLMTGAGSYGGEVPGLFYDRFGRAPGGLSLAELAPEGPRAPPEHAVDDAGRATLVASTTWDGTAGELYRAGAGGPPAGLADIGSDRGKVAGVAQGREDDFFLLRVQEGWSLWLEQHFDDETVRPILLGESPVGASGHLLDLGGQLVVASPVLDPDHRVAAACVDPRAPEPVSPPAVLATRAYSHSPRMARTPRGYAVVWTETDDTTAGLIPMLQVMECCVEE